MTAYSKEKIARLWADAFLATIKNELIALEATYQAAYQGQYQADFLAHVALNLSRIEKALKECIDHGITHDTWNRIVDLVRDARTQLNEAIKVFDVALSTRVAVYRWLDSFTGTYQAALEQVLAPLHRLNLKAEANDLAGFGLAELQRIETQAAFELRKATQANPDMSYLIDQAKGQADAVLDEVGVVASQYLSRQRQA